MARKRLFVLNTISNVSFHFLALLIGFFIIPLFVKDLGQELYGIWILSRTIMGYFSLLDMGVSGGIVKYISESFVINAETHEQEAFNAFEIKMRLQMRKTLEQRSLPVFISSLDDGTKKYIVPVHGKGLWGPIYGFVSLNDDFTTLYGAVFNHDDETPGLGSEINTDWFGAQFAGKKIFNNNKEFISIDLVKGGADPKSLNEVDAISGGTLTSDGLEKMLYDCLGSYQTYFTKQMKNNK